MSIIKKKPGQALKAILVAISPPFGRRNDINFRGVYDKYVYPK
jgi:hypothetical protein